jgi:hypothetical protein
MQYCKDPDNPKEVPGLLIRALAAYEDKTWLPMHDGLPADERGGEYGIFDEYFGTRRGG